jgi:hypothetical protein
VTREVANKADLRFNTISNKVSRVSTIETDKLTISRIEFLFRDRGGDSRLSRSRHRQNRLHMCRN